MIGRVGNNQLTRKLLFHLRGHLSHQEQIMDHLQKDKRILRPSDDPIGTSQSMLLNGQLSRNAEYQKSITQGAAWTESARINIDAAVEKWQRVSELAVSAANRIHSEDAIKGMATELEQLLQGLTQIANSTHNDQYLFSGSRTDVPTFKVETNANTQQITGVFYQGDDSVRQMKAHDQGRIRIGVLGSNGGNPDERGAFVDSTQGVNLFKTLIEFRDKLTANETITLSGVGGIMEQIQAGADSLAAASTRLGGAQESLELDRNSTIQQNAEIERVLKEVEGADLAELMLELNNIQNVYEAALATGGRLLQKGLLNFI